MIIGKNFNNFIMTPPGLWCQRQALTLHIYSRCSIMVSILLRISDYKFKVQTPRASEPM